MKEVRYFYVPDAAHQSELPQDEALHAVRVLRLHEGDEVMLMDGCGTFFRTLITLASNHHCLYKVVETLPQPRPWAGRFHLAIAPTKLMDRMEWMTEKCVEVGLDELTFLNCQFSERRQVKTPRIENIVVSAVKQSRKAWKPQVHGMTGFSDFVNSHPTGRRYIAHCYEEVPRTNLFTELRRDAVSRDALVLIGPEGDFSLDEVRQAVAAGFVSVDLGESRLRTETAGLSAVMMMHLSQI